MKLSSTRFWLGAALAATLATLLLVTALGVTTMQNMLAPANALLAAGVLLYVFLHEHNGAGQFAPLLLNAFACMMWGVADIVYYYLAAQGKSLFAYPALRIVFAAPSIAIGCSFYVSLTKQFRHWNHVQFIADSIISINLIGVFLWIIFFHKDTGSFAVLLRVDVGLMLSILLDVLIWIGTFQWFVSLRSGSTPHWMLVTSLSGNLFALTDCAYLYFKFWNLPTPQLVTDSLFAIALAGLAFGALLSPPRRSVVQPDAPTSNIGVYERWTLVLLFPVAALALTLTGLVPVTITLMDALLFAMLAFMHWVFSRYIRLTVENEQLLAKEKLHNATLEKRVAEQVRELSRLANQDQLTALANRRCFMNDLEDCNHNAAEQDALAVIVLDIDRFKMINDSYGPQTGDAVLVAFAERLLAWNADRAQIARLGGDEFGLLLTYNPEAAEMDTLCAELIELFSQPLTVGSHALQPTVSLGAAASASHTKDCKLLQNAEIALHQAKSQGYNRFQLFDPLLGRDMMAANRIELLLQQADLETEFELFYQPQFSLPQRELIGAEALIRWRSAEHGYISPSVFIPAAERGGQIGKIGRWVFREATRQAATWNRSRGQELKISVNLSPVQLDEPTLLRSLQTWLQEADANASQIDIEVTENVMIRRMDETLVILEQLRDMGFSISIDDFGSGYSSMIYLNRFPFDRLKIDKSLIETIRTPRGSGAHIVKSILDMSKTLGIQTIAEGVEESEQLELLTQLGCDQVQGYLLGRPVPVAEFERMFMGKSQNSRSSAQTRPAAPHRRAAKYRIDSRFFRTYNESKQWHIQTFQKRILPGGRGTHEINHPVLFSQRPHKESGAKAGQGARCGTGGNQNPE